MSKIAKDGWQAQRTKTGSSIWLMLILTALLLVRCTSQGNGAATTPETSVPLADLDVTTGQTIYVPAYS